MNLHYLTLHTADGTLIKPVSERIRHILATTDPWLVEQGKPCPSVVVGPVEQFELILGSYDELLVQAKVHKKFAPCRTSYALHLHDLPFDEAILVTEAADGTVPVIRGGIIRLLSKETLEINEETVIILESSESLF